MPNIANTVEPLLSKHWTFDFPNSKFDCSIRVFTNKCMVFEQSSVYKCMEIWFHVLSTSEHPFSPISSDNQGSHCSPTNMLVFSL